MRIYQIVLFVLLPVVAFSGSHTTGKDIARAANKLIGGKYVWGGNNPKTGIDCSALVKNIYRGKGYKLPRRATWQMTDTPYCPTYKNLSSAKIGDSLYFRKNGKIHHVGVVTGFTKKGEIIMTHAKGHKYGVVREKLSPYYKRLFAGFKRFYECTSPLAGFYTDEEVGSVIVNAGHTYGRSPEAIYDAIDKVSGFNPLLITLKADADTITKISMLQDEGIPVNIVSPTRLQIFPSSIKEAVWVASSLRRAGFDPLLGLLQVPAHRFTQKMLKGAFFPKLNLDTFLKRKD